MNKTPYNPTILLRCNRCHGKTAHLLVNFSNDPSVAITMFYECQDCGETKKVFDLDTMDKVTFEPAKNFVIEEKEQLVPIEKGPQIDQSG